MIEPVNVIEDTIKINNLGNANRKMIYDEYH